MSNFPSVRPSLNLQFDSQPTPADMTSHLASVGATFSRASIGTYTDANGLVAEASAGQARPNYSTAGVHEGLLIEESRTNLVRSSEDFSTTDWTASNSSVIINQAIAPDGTASADKITADTTSSFHNVSDLMANSASTHTLSVYAKPDGYSWLRMNFVGSSGECFFDIENGLVGTAGSTATITEVGNGWYRCTISSSASANAICAINVASSDGVTTFAGDGESGVLIWGAQFEAGSFATSYIPTIPDFDERLSPATFFDSSGVLQTQASQSGASAEGRIDHKYIDGQWVEAGLLLEGASTNLFTDSRPHNWSKNAGTSSSTTTSPISANTYSVLTHNGTNSDPYFSRVASTGSSLANRTFTFSAYIYSISGSTDIQMFMYDSSIGNVFSKSITLTTTPQLYTLTGTFPSNETDTSFTCRFDLAPSTAQSIGVFQAQAEEGSVATSRIPTTSAQVTRSADVYTTATKVRSADVCAISGTAFTDFYNEDEGTFFVYWQGLTNGSDQDRWIGVHDSSKAPATDDRIIFALGQSANTIRLFIADDGVVQTSSINNTGVNHTTPNKYALAVKLNDVNSYQDGSQVHSDTSVTMPSTDKLVFHNGTGSRQYIGYIRKLIYFPRRLTDNELIKLTQ